MRFLATVLAMLLSVLANAGQCVWAQSGAAQEGRQGDPAQARIDKERQEQQERLAVARNEAASLTGIKPRDDREVFYLMEKITGPRNNAKRAAATQAVLDFDRERVLAYLSYKISDPISWWGYADFMINHLPDPRLVPFLAARIRVEAHGEGSALYSSLVGLRQAPADLLQSLVPVLIEHALDNDYEMQGPSNNWWVKSSLAETTHVLDKATGGKSGLRPVGHSEVYGEAAKKAEVRAAWRTWWAANKADWPPKKEAKPDDKPPPAGGQPSGTPPNPTPSATAAPPASPVPTPTATGSPAAPPAPTPPPD